MPVTDTIWDNANQRWNRSVQDGKINPWDFLRIGTALKLLSPDRFRDEQITVDIWIQLHDFLRKLRVITVEFAQRAKYMTLIAAEEIHLTDCGIEIIMPKLRQTLEHKSPQIPVLRRF